MKKQIVWGVTAIAMCVACNVSANIIKNAVHGTERMLKQHVELPFYFGLSTGYGNSDWEEITTVPDSLAAQGAPIGTTGSGGFAWGGFMGYQFSKHFTVEANYVRYPQTTVQFQPDYNNYNLRSLKTNTDSLSFLGKIMVPFGFTSIYVYADAGLTLVHRKDVSLDPIPGENPLVGKVNEWHSGPSFGFGVAMNITRRIFSEAGFQYTTGFDKADAQPAKDYIPFVYNIMFNLGMRL